MHLPTVPVRLVSPTFKVDVPVHPPAACPMCAATNRPPVSWKEFGDGPRP